MDDFTDALDISVLSSLLSRPRVSLHPVIQKPWLKFFREKIRRIMMSSISSKGKITYCNRNICRTSTTKQVLGNCERMVMANLIRNIQGVPKKTHIFGFWQTPLWKGLGRKKIQEILYVIGTKKIKFGPKMATLPKNSFKKLRKFFMRELIFRHPV